MTTSSASFAGPVNSSQAFLTPAFMVPRSQQSLVDYPPLTPFAASEQQQQQEYHHQQQQQLQADTYRQAHPMTSSVNLSINPKLPSLEGLLKQMQTGSPTSSMASTQQRLSPVPREVAPMPSLRTMISPSMAKRVLPVSTLPHAPLPAMTPYSNVVPSAYQQMGSSVGPTFPSKKRSWADATPVQPVMYPVKARSSPGTHSSGTHRSRASKYCKIEGCERVSQRNNLCHSHGGKRLCKEEGCSSKDRGNGYCIKHGGGKICSMSGCEKKARRKGLCTQHFRVSDENSSEDGASPYMTDHSAYGSV